MPAPLVINRDYGFATGIWLDSEQAELHNLNVFESEQGKGYGRALLKDFIAQVRAKGGKIIFLEVAANNAPALHIYKQAGFDSVGVRKGYYKVPNAQSIDAIQMRLDIKN